MTPAPGQPWGFFTPDSFGLSGVREFVIATVDRDAVTLLHLATIQPLRVGHDEFARNRLKYPRATPARKIARRIRQTIKERERYGEAVDAEVADLALSALNWKPETEMERTMGIESTPRTYKNHHDAARGARSLLGKPAAVEGSDFTVDRIDGEYHLTFTGGRDMKMPEKLAAVRQMPTPIERQYGTTTPAATAKRKAAAAIAEVAGVTTAADYKPTPKKPRKPKPAKAPAKKPKVRKAPKRAPKRSKAEAEAAGKGIAAAIAERHGADVFKSPMNGKRIPDGPSPRQVAIDKGAAKVRDEAKAAKTGDQRVIKSVKPNPKREGAAAHARYNLYRVGMTVAEFIKAGGTSADVSWDARKGFIELSAS